LDPISFLITIKILRIKKNKEKEMKYNPYIKIQNNNREPRSKITDKSAFF
jgi:hypothetical protein